ncbi:phospholipid-transporting ATPase ID-like [Nelusetta ayraudi]|uniref:phospholipid-transporting ATPase ID-like n=1 Tax=Nelusetta ayraudi TaxID=303726 RepID=UPI003F717AF8
MGSLSPCMCGTRGRAEERHLRANDGAFNLLGRHANNAIKTSRYNLLTFLPLNLLEQFRRLANVYFLLLLVLQTIPAVSSLPWFTTAVPLLFMLSITGVKDASDDIKRHKSDEQVNNRRVKVLDRGRLQSEKWRDVRVGDIVHLENNDSVTADLLLLSTSEALSLVYLDTAELDGETNLKAKQALSVTGQLGGDVDALAAFSGEVHCEPPNNRLDRFQGTLSVDGQTFAVDNEQVLLRGCTIRNTQWCFGLVLYAGADTKLMQNSGTTTFKRTSVDRLMNILVLCVFIFLIFLCTILALCSAWWEETQGSSFTAFLPRAAGTGFHLSTFLNFISHLIVLNTFVPLSLYVSMEAIRLWSSFFIDWDRKMYHAESGTPAQARTTTLNEELGQIKYIFSDKTGTLTQNIMTFNRCSIGGTVYGCRVEETERTRKVDFSWNQLADPTFVFHDDSLVKAVRAEQREAQAFFRLLALCHTVMPEEKEEGKLFYQAQSPDEGALVTAARNFGFVFRYRTPESITLMEAGQEVVYELLAILDFNNVRKRMSVIVRDPKGQLRLYCKGADTTVFERLHPSCQQLKEVTTGHLNEYASDGLRTLALAYKDLDEEYMVEWRRRHHEASISMEGREEQLDELYEEIERDLLLLGATAVEDKLQDGVPHTIEQLAKADIKIWMLTGDKQETAENIGYSCNMLRDEMRGIFIVAATTAEGVREELRAAWKKMSPGSSDDRKVSRSCSGLLWLKATQTVEEEQVDGQYGLIINGHSLALALEGPELELELLRTACMCQTVICCRVTPLQKAQVVRLVKKYKQAVTLAIGDGANDVSMIKAAHIGVGISGQEGMQAVLSSDFSFAQFRYLQRLLLVHGRWSYIRMCKFLRYFFFKNVTFTFLHVWYAFFCGFSAQIVYDNWFITLYNWVYTSLPILGLSLCDQDVSATRSLRRPALYWAGQRHLHLNKRLFLRVMLHGCCSSLLLFFVPWAATRGAVRSDGKDGADHQTFALLVQTGVLLVVTAEVCLETLYWTAVNQLFVVASVLAYFAVVFTLSSADMFFLFTSSFSFVGAASSCLREPAVWLTLLLTFALCLLPSLALRFLQVLLWPSVSDRARHQVRQEVAPAPQAAPAARRKQASRRRSSYAFSHSQGFGDLLTSRRGVGLRALRARPGLLTHNWDSSDGSLAAGAPAAPHQK